MGICNKPWPVFATGMGISVLSREAEDGLCSFSTKDACPPAGTCYTDEQAGLSLRSGDRGGLAGGWHARVRSQGRGLIGDECWVPVIGQSEQVAGASPAARVATMRAHSLSVHDMSTELNDAPAKQVGDGLAE